MTKRKIVVRRRGLLATYRRRHHRSPTFGRALSRWWRRLALAEKLAIIVIGTVVVFGGAGAQHGHSAPAPRACRCHRGRGYRGRSVGGGVPEGHP